MPCRDVQNGVGINYPSRRCPSWPRIANIYHLICFELMTEIQKEGDNGRVDRPPRKQHLSHCHSTRINSIRIKFDPFHFQHRCTNWKPSTPKAIKRFHDARLKQREGGWKDEKNSLNWILCKVEACHYPCWQVSSGNFLRIWNCRQTIQQTHCGRLQNNRENNDAE